MKKKFIFEKKMWGIFNFFWNRIKYLFYYIYYHKAIKIFGIVKDFLEINQNPLDINLKKQIVYIQNIQQYVEKLYLPVSVVTIMCLRLKSIDEFFAKYNNLLEIKQMGFEKYIDFSFFLKLDETSQELYIQIVRDFKNYKLDENGQGDIKQFIEYVKIPFEHIVKIKDVMVATKMADCPLSQKDIVRYYDSYRPFTEDLDMLKDAWIIYNQKLKQYNIYYTIQDFIRFARIKLDIKQFINNMYRICQNEISFRIDCPEVLNLENEKITELVTSLIKVKFAGIIIDYALLYPDLQLIDVNQVLTYLIKFKKAGFELTYLELRNYFFFNKDLEKLLRAFIYNNQSRIYTDYKELYKRFMEVISNKPPNVNIDPLLFLVSIEKAIKNKIVEAQDDNLFELTELQVKRDYLAGHDVFTNLSMMELLAKHNIKLSYTALKIIEKSIGNDEDRIQKFKNIILSAIQPILFEGESFVVTTKDNIEIKAQIVIEALLNLNNYFAGADEKILLLRANTIFIDEIQKKYNHDEIIVNIDKISNNILYRLLEETPSQAYKYIDPDKMVKVDSHSGHFDTHSYNSNEKYNKEHHDEHQNSEKMQEQQSSEKQFTNEKEPKLLTSSKYIPRRILIPKIDFVKSTFKEYEKEKEQFEIHKMQMFAEIEKIKTEIELYKSWAESKDSLKYLILKDDKPQSNLGH